MPFSAQRIAPDQILTDAPIDAAREAVWHAFSSHGLEQVTIDVHKNAVGASRSASAVSNGQRALARFESRPDGTLITVRARPVVPGTVDFGKSKRQTRDITDKVAQVLAAGWQREIFTNAPQVPPPGTIAPIATPTEHVAATPAPIGNAIFGPIPPVKQGSLILVYGIISLCCQCAAPFTIWYGISALQDYGRNDPGDKSLVIIGLVLGILGCVLILLRILAAVAGSIQ